MNICILFIYISITTADAINSKKSLSIEGKLNFGHKVQSVEINYMGAFAHFGILQCSTVFVTEFHTTVAAKCLHEFLLHPEVPDFKHYSVVTGFAGTHRKGVNHEIDKLEVHPSYKANNESTFNFNIGIITLLQSAKKLDNICWIPLQKCQDDKYIKAEIIGWSVMREGESSGVSITLLRSEVQILENYSCGLYLLAPIICVSFDGTDETLEEGDFGAPLIQNSQFIGIFSKRVSNNLAIFTNLCTTYGKISPMLKQSNWLLKSLYKIPRTKARHEWYHIKEKFRPL